MKNGYEWPTCSDSHTESFVVGVDFGMILSHSEGCPPQLSKDVRWFLKNSSS